MIKLFEIHSFLSLEEGKEVGEEGEGEGEGEERQRGMKGRRGRGR